jgi:hypothetical protein
LLLTGSCNANARVLGSHQADAIRNITGLARTAIDQDYTRVFESHQDGAFAGGPESADIRVLQNGLTTTSSYLASRTSRLNFNASLVVPTGGDNRPSNVAFAPRIIAY